MNQPQKPYPPSPFEYEEKVERKYIYSCTETLQEADCDDGCWDDEEERPKPEIPIEDVTLEWLMSKVPAGISPSQIKIEFGYNASSMAYEDHYVNFYYEVTVPARKAEYKAAQKQYEADLAQYEKDLEAYKLFCREEEIKATEAKLARLKDGK